MDSSQVTPKQEIQDVKILITELQFLDKVKQIKEFHEEKIQTEIKMMDLVV